MIGAADGPPSGFTDTFTRPNAATLGAPWVEHVSAIPLGNFGILDDSARTTRTSSSVILVAAVVDLGTPIGLTEWDMTVWRKGPVYSIFRFVDIANFWFVAGTSATDTTMYLLCRSGGTNTVVATALGVTWGAGHRLGVEDDGTSIAVKVNGSTISALNTTDTTHATATRSGFGGNTQNVIGDLSSARWSRFHIGPR